MRRLNMNTGAFSFQGNGLTLRSVRVSHSVVTLLALEMLADTISEVLHALRLHELKLCAQTAATYRDILAIDRCKAGTLVKT